MTELKIQHILTLAHLLSKGARRNFVAVTTAELGRSIKKSQQAASRHLLELENGRFVERAIDGRNVSIRVTAKGHSEVLKLSSVLQRSLGSTSGVELEGRLVSGMGEGAYYMSLRGYARQFKSKIGYVPFPGTLNVRLESKLHRDAIKQLGNLEGVRINGFSDGKRTYGWVKCFGCTVNGSIRGELVILERTHHDDSIIEVISGTCIRDSGRLKDGSRVLIEVRPDP